MKIWDINKEEEEEEPVKKFRNKPRSMKSETPNFKFEYVAEMKKILELRKK